MAQWCAPWRRQQNGKRDSSPPGSRDARGPSHSSRVSVMESARRTFYPALQDDDAIRGEYQQSLDAGQVSSGHSIFHMLLLRV